MSYKREYLSYSALKAFAKSPNHYIDYVTGERQETAAMTFGSAFHCMVLEPDEWDSRYAVAPDVDRRTKAGKMEYNLFVAQNEGKTAISASDLATMQAMADAVSAHLPAAQLLSSAAGFEVKTTEKLLGTPFTGIADVLGCGWVADLKTTVDASPESFMRTAHNSAYHEQAAAYCRLFNVQRFYWIAVEKAPPYNVAVYMQSEIAHHKADKRLMTLVEMWNGWDGKPQSYAETILTLNLPSWA